jgi:hypothetical protein
MKKRNKRNNDEEMERANIIRIITKSDYNSTNLWRILFGVSGMCLLIWGFISHDLWSLAGGVLFLIIASKQ